MKSYGECLLLHPYRRVLHGLVLLDLEEWLGLRTRLTPRSL
jgi:hypothetical protein